MKSWRWNGAAYEPCDSVPLTDRGFRYGMAVFESLRVNADGTAEFFDKHLARLVQACAEREIPVEESALAAAEALLRDAWRAEVKEGGGAGMGERANRRKGDFPTHRLADSQIPSSSPSTTTAFARLYVTAGDGGPAAPAEHPRLFVFLEPRTPPDPDDPWEIGLHDESYHPPFRGLKTANYWFNCDALSQARRRNFNEALLFNDRAELVSACTANVFLLRGDRLCTPARSSGCRPGVIREWVIARRKVEERRLRREDVVNADEIFLTNSWIGVMPVATVEGRPLGHRTIGPRLVAELAHRRDAGN
jgi:branched-subunit amino acid aminotransferase/4-amino-4-deoxychorismate lyase